MRRKLLSLLTVLCLVLGMLPTTALAAAATAYEEGDVALVITTDYELTEDVDGLVVVDAPVEVTVKDVTLSVGIVVSPDAAGAKVALTGECDIKEVVVLSAASVTVDEDAKVTYVTVDAAEAAVEVAGTVESVTVTENAESAAVVVTETATVAAVEVAAPSVKVEVAGTVESVTVAETATGVELVVAETATVTAVTDKSGELVVSGDGADKVEVTKDEEPAEEEEPEEEEPAEEEEEPAEEEKPAETATTGNTAPPMAGVMSVDAPRIVWAPLHDKATNGTTVNGATVQGGEDQTAALTTSHGIDVSNVQELDNGAIRATVTLSATGLDDHKNANNTLGYWIGFGVDVTDHLNEAKTQSDYTYYYFAKTESGYAAGQAIPTAPGRVYEASPDFFVNTIYFDVGSSGEDWDGTIVVVVDGTLEGTGEGGAVTLEDALADEDVVYVIDVDIDVESTVTTPVTT